MGCSSSRRTTCEWGWLCPWDQIADLWHGEIFGIITFLAEKSFCSSLAIAAQCYFRLNSQFIPVWGVHACVAVTSCTSSCRGLGSCFLSPVWGESDFDGWLFSGLLLGCHHVTSREAGTSGSGQQSHLTVKCHCGLSGLREGPGTQGLKMILFVPPEKAVL